jgi:hypothetical protein
MRTVSIPVTDLQLGDTLNQAIVIKIKDNGDIRTATVQRAGGSVTDWAYQMESSVLVAAPRGTELSVCDVHGLAACPLPH